MHERACITNKAYIRAADHKTLLGRLKYWTFREDRNHQIPQDHGEERWRDRGLGQDYHTIYANCQRFATQGLNNDVAARTLVISPETHLMQAIPQKDRQSVLEELTERVVEGWFDRLDLPVPEYAYAIHNARSKDVRPDGRAKDMRGNDEFLHTHVVLAATVPGLTEERENYGVFAHRGDMAALHEASQEAVRELWTRELGVERVQELTHDLETRAARMQALDHTIDLTLDADREIADDNDLAPLGLDAWLEDERDDVGIVERLGIENPDDLDSWVSRDLDEME